MNDQRLVIVLGIALMVLVGIVIFHKTPLPVHTSTDSSSALQLGFVDETTPADPATSRKIYFSGTYDANEGDTATYRIDYGDGTSGEGSATTTCSLSRSGTDMSCLAFVPFPRHQYGVPGKYIAIAYKEGIEMARDDLNLQYNPYLGPWRSRDLEIDSAVGGNGDIRWNSKGSGSFKFMKITSTSAIGSITNSSDMRILRLGETVEMKLLPYGMAELKIGDLVMTVCGAQDYDYIPEAREARAVCEH